MKRQKSSDDDWITALPNSVISTILSLLPTISAFATSFLSEGWKLRWTEVTNFDFDDKPWSDPKTSPPMSFLDFVNMVLNNRKKDQIIEKFHLRWELCDPPFEHLDKWVSTAIGKYVRVLELDSFSGSAKVIELPGAIYTCGTLEVLKLKGTLLVKLSTGVWLPKLAVMELIKVKYESDESFHKLISGCPVLESLTIYRYYVDENIVVFKVSSPVIKRLYIYTEDKFICPHDVDPYSVEINAPALEFFALHDNVSSIVSIHDVGSVNEVDLDISLCIDCDDDRSKADMIARAVQAFPHAKVLKLSKTIMAGLIQKTFKLSTRFERLTKLVLEFDVYGWRNAMDFIDLCNNLEVLDILCVDGVFYRYNSDDDDDDDDDAAGGGKGNGDDADWSPVVPTCLSSSLRQVSIRAFDSRKGSHRMEMLGFFLKHGLFLETVDLYSKRPLRLANTLAEMHQGSADCKISSFSDS